MKKILVFSLLWLLPGLLSAQCAMCRAVLESEESNTVAQGVNNGIIYLMAIPYLLLFVIGYLVYRKMKN